MLRLAGALAGPRAGAISMHSAAAHAAVSAARPAAAAAAHAHVQRAAAVATHRLYTVPSALHGGVRSFSSLPNPSSSRAISPLQQLHAGAADIMSALARMAGGGVPKGWERFFPEQRSGPRGKVGREGNEPAGAAGAEKKAEDAAADTFNAAKRNSGGGGGGSGGDQDNNVARPNWGLLLMSGFLFYIFYKSVTGEDANGSTPAHDELTWQDFKTRYLERGLVDHLYVEPEKRRVNVFLKPGTEGSTTPTTVAVSGDGSSSSSSNTTAKKDGSKDYFFNIGSVDSFNAMLKEAQIDQGFDPNSFVPVRYAASSVPGASGGSNIASWVIWGAIIGSVFLIWRRSAQMMQGGGMPGGMGGRGGGPGGMGNFTKSTAQLIKAGESKVTFADVAGLDEAKVEVMEFVKFLQAPDKFTKLGAKIPKGALLQGPPGTGKTLLAKAVAGEAGVPFWTISGSQFQEMYVGVGSARVRDLFKEARANTPCIIFIDEIDAIGRARGNGPSSGADRESENTLNQLLVEMDGMGTTEGVIVLAGTNRRDMLDKALLRPGRFDRHITIDKPDMRGRAQIFMVHLKPLRTDPRHTLEDLSQRLAALTPGFAGADISNLCNEAALIAARADKESVELSDFELASDRVLGGLEKKNGLMSLEEKTLVAHHEAGHAVAAWFLEHADPLLKVTIVPRTSGALGFAQYLPKELSLYHQGQLSDMMAMALGGRAAEQIFFGRVSTGASDDLQKVTRIAQAQVTTYGMSEKLGQVSYADDKSSQFTKPFSEATAQAIDEEVRALIATTYARTLALLEKHRAQVAALAGKLIEIENVNHDILLEILGPRPFASDAYTSWRKQNLEAQQARAQEKAAAEAAKAEEKRRNDEADSEPVAA